MHPPRRSAFTLLELMIVLFIIGTVIGVLLIALNRDRRGQDNGATRNHLRQHGLAAHEFCDSYRRLPPAFDSVLGKGPFSVHVHLLPFLEQKPAFDAFAAGRGNPDAVIQIFTSPSDPSGETQGVQNFAANLRIFSKKGFDTPYNAPMPALAECEPGEATIRGSFPDGISNTIMFATRYGACGNGGSRFAANPASGFAAFFGQVSALSPAHPSQIGATYQLFPAVSECRSVPLTAQSFWKHGLIVALSDVSVRHVSPGVSAETWNRALHPSDGQALGKDWDD
jgi:prepilin-type N-terminal cleavage/methylation domain-containing protein